MASSTEILYPRAGKDYPRNFAEFLAWFPDENACRDYLDWLRWPNGFLCPHCAGLQGWRLTDGCWWCGQCRCRVSVTAGTVFHRSQTPLSVWFAAAWLMTAAKNGVSAKTLHRLLGFGSYQTAWALLHRLRSAMVRPGRERLSGVVEVNEMFIGGVRPGKLGRGAAGKVLVAVAVEQIAPMGFGRCRLQVIPNTESATLRTFLQEHVELGSHILTDGLSAYSGAILTDYMHNSRPVKGSGRKAHELLPGVHRVASLVKRWLLGTHQGAVEADHVQAYLDEFTFRFNRRRSRARGMLFYRLLQYAVQSNPVPYKALVKNASPRTDEEKKPKPTNSRRTSPPSLRLQVSQHPWR
jgi:transposase-like protein